MHTESTSCNCHALEAVNGWVCVWFRIIDSLNRCLILEQLARTTSLCAYSYTVAAKPKEWPANVIVTGWWFEETENEDSAEYVWNPDLEDFLSRGR